MAILAKKLQRMGEHITEETLFNILTLTSFPSKISEVASTITPSFKHRLFPKKDEKIEEKVMKK